MRIRRIISILLCGGVFLQGMCNTKVLADPPYVGLLELISKVGDNGIEKYKAFLEDFTSVDSRVDVSGEDVLSICDRVEDILKAEPNILEIDGRTFIVGDTHSNFDDTKFIMKHFLDNLERIPDTKILFLGDYVDRGTQCKYGPEGVKNLIFLYLAKIMFPKNVFLLRGNHEDINMCSQTKPGQSCLLSECQSVYGENFKMAFDKIADTFPRLPLAAIVNYHSFCVHGGISPDLDLGELGSIDRVKAPTVSAEHDGIMEHILWNDPCPYFDYVEQERGKDSGDFNEDRKAGVYFSSKDVIDFLDKYDMKRIIRAHQFPMDGLEYNGSKQFFTLFSSSNYENFGTKGAFLVIDRVPNSEGRADSSVYSVKFSNGTIDSSAELVGVDFL